MADAIVSTGDSASSWFSDFNDVFKTMASTYVQVRQIEKGNPAQYNQYAYGTITGQQNGTIQQPYYQAMAQQQQTAAAGGVNWIVVGALALAAWFVIKK